MLLAPPLMLVLLSVVVVLPFLACACQHFKQHLLCEVSGTTDMQDLCHGCGCGHEPRVTAATAPPAALFVAGSAPISFHRMTAVRLALACLSCRAVSSRLVNAACVRLAQALSGVARLDSWVCNMGTP